MKNLFLTFIVSAAIAGCSATAVTVNIEPISKVIQDTGPKSDAFVKANAWMIDNFRDARSVIQFSDKEEGEIIGRYFMHQTVGQAGQLFQDVFATIRIRIKDDAVKIIISPDQYTTNSSSALNPALYFPEEMAVKEIYYLINSFETFILQEKESF